MPSKTPGHDAPAEEWIRAGLAIPTARGANANFRDISFTVAQANALVFLTGKGALTLDREGMKQQPTPPI